MRLLSFSVLCTVVILITGCSETPAENELPSEFEVTPLDTISAVDSIGILMGDSCYTLGAISDYTMLPDASPAILDRIKGTVSVFDSNGIFQRSFGGFGGGPGEFQYPFALTRLSSGIIVVAEMMLKMNAFNENGEFLSGWTMDGLGGLPLDCFAFDDSTFVCYCFTMSVGTQGINVTYSLNRYHAITGEVVAEYFAWSGNPTPSTDFTPGYIVATSDGLGKMYLSRIQSDSWMVEVYGEEAEALDTLVLFHERERISAPDTVMVPGALPLQYAYSDENGSSEMAFVNMPDHHPFISALGVDGDGNIWCRRGGAAGDHWDVVSPSGEHLREIVVALPDSAYYIDMQVNPYGVLAFDMLTEDYHKLYIMGD